MTRPVIVIERLAKHYQLGEDGAAYQTLRDSLARAVRLPFRQHSSPHKTGLLKSIWALQDVSFEVSQGEVIGIIGRNGAGKSTLLKILARITRPTRGKVILRGRVGSLLEVGTGFHPELTGRENIYLNGAILGMKRAEIARKFDEIVDFSEIEQFLDTPVKHYSSGMYMRLAFSVAAHLEPEILLVDEVLAVGDVAFQKKCLGKMGRVAREGRTVLFISHNMVAVRNLCSRAYLLEQGKIEASGAVDAVISHYLAADARGPEAVITLPPGEPGAAGQAISLDILNRSGSPQASFRLGEPWRARLEFEIFRPTPHVIAGVGMMTVEFMPVITFWSRPQDLQPGKYWVEFEFSNPLSACDLMFAAGLSSFEQSFYYVQEVGRVSIHAVAEGEQPHRSSGSGLLSSIQAAEIQPAVKL